MWNPRSCERNFCNNIAYIEAWKIQDFNGVWTRDLMIPVRRFHQLCYEATDSGKNCIHNCKGSELI